MNNIFSWNVRGLNKVNKQIEVARLLSLNNISLLGLLETKVKRKGLGALYLRMCPNWCLTTNLAWHNGGRIIVGWKSDELQVNIVTCSSQLIHISVTPKNNPSFFCTFVYGASEKNARLQLFQVLHALSLNISLAWIIMGDFNCIANFDERRGQPVRLHEIQPLRDCMMECGVRDLHYNGRFFTWTNMQAGDKRVMNKIDRVLGNDLWEEAFPSAFVSFLPEGNFDHSSMVVRFSQHTIGFRPFRFYNFWTLKEDFLKTVNEVWDIHIDGVKSFQIS